jgi:DNA polymerase
MDMSTYHLDYESYSEADLTVVGAHAYAHHPSTKLLLAAVAKDDGPVLLWDHTRPSLEAWELLMEMSDDDGPIVAHNSAFEEPLTEYLFTKTFGLPAPDPDRWVCTAAMCRRAAIPWSLSAAGTFLNLTKQKKGDGRALIKMFCVPVDKFPKNWDPVEGWETFRRYCIQDVETERELYHRLRKSFALPREAFRFDARMNNRGVPVNRAALQNAKAIADHCLGQLQEEFTQITGLQVSQREAVLAWLKTRGYPAENLQAGTMEGVLEDPPEAMDEVALRALALRAGSSFASLSKIPTMLAASEHDGRVRGGFLWSGALRTHRWSGRIIQPQNFKRPSIKDTHIAYEMIKRGEDVEAFEMMWGAGLPEIIASCIRHFIEAPGRMLLDADYANIEARITPWLCGQEDMLDEFRSGEDVYVTMAAFIFNVPQSNVTKDQRFVGKVAILSAQFGTGWKKFQQMCKMYGRDLDNETSKLVITKYREKRDKIIQGWRDIDNAAKEAIRNQGHVINACRCDFVFGKLGTAGFHALQMRLPSGHRLTYPLAKIERVTKKFDNGSSEVDEIQFWGQLKGTSAWGWVSTWGARLLENATQAVGGDFMTEGLLEAERRGYQPFATIHDQALCEQLEGQTPEGLREAMCVLPKWAEGFPLEATAAVTPFYTKD